MPAASLLSKTELGKASQPSDSYDASRLHAIPRAATRGQLGISQLPFHGLDYWTSFEFSWLNLKGKPEIAIAEFIIPADSINLIESKSFKLYLNSFYLTYFENADSVKKILQRDLSQSVQADVAVKLMMAKQFSQQSLQEFSGICLDTIDLSTSDYNYNPAYLQTENLLVTETVYTNLFKSNCPITKQFDWASVMINYQGEKVNHAALLKYLISYRQHTEFHEQCVERIFVDMMKACAPEKLTVYARFNRRGGLDLNPFRSNFEAAPKNVRNARQ